MGTQMHHDHCGLIGIQMDYLSFCSETGSRFAKQQVVSPYSQAGQMDSGERLHVLH